MDASLVGPVLLVLLGGGLLAAIASFRKAPAEKQAIIITAAQGAVVVQSGVIEDLREELDRAHSQIATLTEELHAEVSRLRSERDALRAENTKLRQRIRTLEARVEQLEANPSAESS